ncbi:MAG: DUF1178 family protein [Pseudomonadota bacterium]
MIRYALTCEQGHRFESWFQSAEAYEKLEKAGHLACTVCGSSDVKKALMAPRVSASPESDVQPEDKTSQPDPKEALAALRKQVEQNAEYVGPRFADEARSMFLGGSPDRAIYGEASGAEAKSLIDDGVPVAPLPFIPNRKAN